MLFIGHSAEHKNINLDQFELDILPARLSFTHKISDWNGFSNSLVLQQQHFTCLRYC